MGPFKPFMLKALDKIKDLNLKYICPGHGLVLDHTNIEKFVNLYREWCQPTKREKQSIVIPYVTAYGYTEEIAKEIKRGIEASNFDVDILMYNLVTADMNEVLNEINQCSGLLLGSPTLLSDTLPQIWTILSSLNPVIHKGLPASCFGSYGWSGEALKNINERYKQLKFNVVCEPLGIVFRPSEENLKSAYDFGLEFANKVLK
ncbi:flavodoxin domain-containing protein [Clostridium saudiense]